ncbi:alpha-1,3-mannosyl-glycoprotein 4-beta-N-acetylglucosaminyltransferase A-like [Ostrinia nubilalis]|uniref:alpha-1,3-mannosyl-glycoprotein 4-beta-N-acetylglucosaminyltransferase A-like n=1 Tax=Ostrinia nubilalis TaxID=29057 RepID=UPI0030826B72
MGHAAVGVSRALASCAYAPRKKFYLLLLGAFALSVIVLGSFTSPLPREEEMEQRLAAMQSNLQFLESLYRSRQEDIISLETKVTTKHKQGEAQDQGAFDGGFTTVTPELQALLRNITGTKAAGGIFPKSIPDMRLPFLYQLLPYLMNDPNSLRPAYHMTGGRIFADVVIGVPTVKRDKENYLMITLTHLISGLTEADLNSTLIVVMVGETDLEYVINTARQVETMFSKHVESGLIEVISASPTYYPDFDSLPITLGDSQKRVKWRTKQNLDTVYLMAYAQSKGTFYLMLEDDVIAKNHYMQDIKKFAAQTSVSNPDWFYIEYCQVGGIGKLFKSSNLTRFIIYVQLFYNNMPIDWLLESYLADKICTIEKTSKTCMQSKLQIRPRYKTSLFQHIGLYSSLKGKIQKIKDSHFGAVPTFYPHNNPPIEDIKTNIDEHSDHTLRRAYDGVTYFWGITPKKGDFVKIIFEKPTAIEKYTFRSGNVEHVSDKFYDTTIEVLPANKGNYTVVGKFDEFGMAEGEISKDFGPLAAIKLSVNKSSQYWVILSEIELRPVDQENR